MLTLSKRKIRPFIFIGLTVLIPLDKIDFLVCGAEASVPATDAQTEDALQDLLPDLAPATESNPLEDHKTRSDKGTEGASNPVTQIGEKMRRAEKHLQEKAAQGNPKTEQLQQKIVQELNALLKQLNEQSQQQSASGSPSNSQQQQQKSNRSPVKQPVAQQGKASQLQEDKGEPSRDSTQRLGKAAPRVNLVELAEVLKEIWGHLPAKDRERLRQGSADQVMPGHDIAVEKYFRRLAEDAEKQNPTK